MLDTNHDQKIQATELRQAVQSGVQALFTVADTNQDGQLSPYELNAAVGEAAKSAVQTVFQAADADRNGSLSMDEYDKALAEPAHALFRVIDANNDNQISLAELRARRADPRRPDHATSRARAAKLAVEPDPEWRRRRVRSRLQRQPVTVTAPAPRRPRRDSSLTVTDRNDAGWSLPAGNDPDRTPSFLDANRVEGGGCRFLPLRP